MDNAWLNHGGNTPDNPLVSGAAFTLKLSKQDSNETLRKVWVNAGKSVISNVTSLAVVTDFEITVPVVAGVHLRAGSPAVKNVVHFTTSKHRHARAIVWVASRPAVMITLDGYNAEDPDKPLIYPLFDPAQGAI